MKNGKCPQCGASEVRVVPFLGGHRDYRPVRVFSKGIKLNEYVCCRCGLVATHLADLGDAERVREKCRKVETPE